MHGRSGICARRREAFLGGEADHDVEEAGLPASRGAHDADEFAALNVQVNLLENVDRLPGLFFPGNSSKGREPGRRDRSR
jgi:hypothetical protein